MVNGVVRMMKLVEERSGIGELMLNETTVRQVRYSVSRFQGIVESSGLPIPGLYKIEGSIDFDAGFDICRWIGTPLRLRLEDGRVLGVTVVNAEGRVLSEGHGPSKCLCC
jgi:hypothetical protein